MPAAEAAGEEDPPGRSQQGEAKNPLRVAFCRGPDGGGVKGRCKRKQVKVRQRPPAAHASESCTFRT